MTAQNTSRVNELAFRTVIVISVFDVILAVLKAEFAPPVDTKISKHLLGVTESIVIVDVLVVSAWWMPY